MNIAVFASGKGSNFSAIIKAAKKGKISGAIALLVCDQEKAGVLNKAKRAEVKTAVILRKQFASKTDFENKIIQALKENNIKLIVLAGFMRLLSPEFVKLYSGQILNIHPSLLPAFKGGQSIQDAFNYGVKITGVTAHFVDEEMDHGPIILQETIKIKKTDTLQSLEARIHRLEHKLYPQAIELVLRGHIT